MGETQSVLLAGYQSLEPAEKDFDQLVQLVKDKKVKTEGVILVEKDEEGRVTVDQTGDHLGRKGMGWGGGVGIAVGLAAPPLLAATVVGAAGGALLGKLASHKVESGLESGLGEKLKPGTAAIVAIIDDDDRLAAEQALARLAAKSVAPIDGHQRPEGCPRRSRRQVQPRPHRAAHPRPRLRRGSRGARSTSRLPTGPSSPGRRRPRTRPTC